MNSNRERTGVLLLGFGAPSDIDEVEGFLKSITGTQRVPENYLKQIMEKYIAIGGSSPFKRITSELREKLQNSLGESYSVTCGFRHSSPTISDSVNTLVAEGIKKILCLPLTPHYSYFSTGDYIKRVKESISEKGGTEIYPILSWHNHPEYINLLIKSIMESLKDLPSGEVCILFTAHSLPVEKIPPDDPYVSQLNETVSLVKENIPTKNLLFRLAYQSRRAGMDRWLEPDVNSELEKIYAEGIRDVIVVPLSFVSDHLETLYDIDILLKRQAEAMGIHLKRTPSFNTGDAFVNLLKIIIIDFMKKSNI